MSHVAGGGREPRDSKARGGVQGCNVQRGHAKLLDIHNYYANTRDLLY
jgi:hypothetical protein